MNYKSRTHVDLHVIDAVNKDFLLKWGSETDMLRQSLGGAPINIVTHSAVDAASLRKAIEDVRDYRETYAVARHSVPYLHISCHGRKDALIIGESKEINWDDVSEALLPLLERTDYHLALSLSSCWGYHGASLADVMSSSYVKRRPYYSLVGPRTKEGVVSLCGAFAEFYRCLLVDFRKIKKSIELANKVGPAKLDYTKGARLVDRFAVISKLFGR